MVRARRPPLGSAPPQPSLSPFAAPQLTHPNLVSFRGTGYMFTAGGGLTIFLGQELMEGGSVYDMLIKQHRLYANPMTEQYLMYLPGEAF